MESKKILEEYKFETLYGNDAKGKIKTWDIKVEKYETHSEIVTFYGYNRLIETRRQINSGKNLGKSNATTHYTQAISEASSKWYKKRDIEKYINMKELNRKESDFQTKELDQENPLPMLANDYKKNKEKVKKLLNESKIMIQPKLDGYRMIYNSTTKQMTTRQGKEYNIIKESGKLYEELLKLPKGYIFDGELYTSKVNFEVLGVLRKTKKLTDEDNEHLSKIEYHIYDIVDTTQLFEQRNKLIKNIVKDNFEKLIYVQTYDVKNEEQLKEFHTKFLEDNYEGTMIRNKESLYKIKQRSNDLLKYKDFEDSEYKIVDYTFEKDTSGKDENLIIWIVDVPVCIVLDGHIEDPELEIEKGMIKCKVRPMGTKDERKDLYKKCVENFDQFKGKNLWVKYFEKTKDGNLRFPTTKANVYTEYIRGDTY
jgi:ATP-dependent DNA ligase